MNRPGGASKPRGRPRGDVRTALAQWARRWQEGVKAGGASIAELAATVPGMSAKSPSDMRMVRQTLMSMLRDGEVVAVGQLPRPGKRGKPPTLYAPTPLADVSNAVQTSAVLADVLGAWTAQTTGVADHAEADG